MTGLGQRGRRSRKGRPTLRHIVTAGFLVLAWCALWGEVTVANLLSGTLIAALVTSSGVGTGGRGGVRLRPLARLAAIVAVDLVVSTATVAWEIMTPADRTEEAIVAVRVPAEARDHLLLLVVAVTVTPGTAVVDADPDTGTLYLHLLHEGRRPQVERHVQRLAGLVCAALPTGGAPATPSGPSEVPVR